MSDMEIQKLQREVQELRAEVRRTRHLIEGAVAIVALGLVLLFPQLLIVALALGALILFGLLVSPFRRMIFGSIFRKSDLDRYEG